MRIDTLLLIPITAMVCYSLYSVSFQHKTTLLNDFVECDAQRPFTYYLQLNKNEKSQCGWSDFQYWAIIILFIANLTSCALGYFISHKFWLLMVVAGETAFGFSVYLYKKAYDAHAFCQSQIIPVLKNHNKRIICKDDAYYVVVGMMFLLSLLVVFYAVMYVIKDENGVSLGDITFGMAPDTEDEQKKEKKEDKTD